MVRRDFAKAVRLWRGQLGLSQEELAERAGLHRTYISDVERGARNLSLESINRLASALEVSVSTLFQSSPGIEPAPREPVDILLVEDNNDDAEMAMLAFKKARIANLVHVVQDGVEALDYVFCRGLYAGRRHEGRPHVILLDLYLPKLNGFEVLRRIKEEKSTRRIPVVVLTSSQKSRDIDQCRRLGAETYIVKPVDFQSLSQVTPVLKLNWILLNSQPALLG